MSERDNSERSGVRGVVVGHGDMPRGLVDAVTRIAGEAANGLTAVSNEGKGPDLLRSEVDAAAGPGPAIVFVDLQSGSCGLAAAYACRGCMGRRAVICGVNLPMLLDFVFHRDLALDALVDRLVDAGRAAIRATPAAS
jgi:mannose/fructose-specific phosphotransferase system component IIA